MELIEDSNLQLGLPEQHHKSLTEISDDEVNLPPSDDEEDIAASIVAALADSTKDNEKDNEGEKGDGQVNGVLVLALLDKIIGAVDQIQQTQAGLETRQVDMERSVSGIQGELTKLSKSHTNTANSVNKMLEKVRKVSVNVKTVRSNLEKQAGQIKRLESNEAELLKRRNFKVMIYQDDVKLSSKVTVGKSMKVAEPAEGEEGPELKALEEGGEGEGEKAHIDLSSDEEEVEIEETVEETRAERIKRSSLQRVQNIKTAFSREKMDKTKQKTKDNMEKTKQNTKERMEKTKQNTKERMEKTKLKTKESLEKTKQKTKENLEKTRLNIEKKMGKLSTRMSVNPDRKVKMQTSKDKLKKSFTPDHPVYARSVTAVYKVPPFTFHVKKIRDGEVELQGTEMVEVSGDVEELEHTCDGEEDEVEMAEMGEMLTEDSPEMQALMEMAEDHELALADHDLDRDSD